MLEALLILIFAAVMWIGITIARRLRRFDEALAAYWKNPHGE
jgi:hypothetical protein